MVIALRELNRFKARDDEAEAAVERTAEAATR